MAEQEKRPDLGDKLNVNDLRNLYLQHLEARVKQGDLTQPAYYLVKLSTRYFRDLPEIAELPLSDLTIDHAELFRAWGFEQKYKPSFIGELLCHVMGMLNWARRPRLNGQRLLLANPWEGLSISRKRDRKQYKPSDATRRFIRLAAALYRNDNAERRGYSQDIFRLLRLARLTGCRPGELYGLR